MSTILLTRFTHISRESLFFQTDLPPTHQFIKSNDWKKSLTTTVNLAVKYY